jgi:signal peptidase I
VTDQDAVPDMSEPAGRTVTGPDDGSPASAGPGGAPRTTWYDPTPPEPAEKPRGHGVRRFLTELPVLVLIAFVLALLLKTFLIQAFYIPSSSMEPTLDIGDRVLVNKVVYRIREPRRGEVVVFSERSVLPVPQEGNVVTRLLRSMAEGLGMARPDEKDFIKRIIGLPGETLEYRDGVIYIDGTPLPESTTSEGGYLSSPDFAPFGPVTVPADHYFMMGDNRPSSADSRSLLGTIPRQDIIGRAFVVIWPAQEARRLPIAEYGRAGASAGPWPHSLVAEWQPVGLAWAR